MKTNYYNCTNPACKHRTGTVHREEGTTPMFLQCPLCKSRAVSCMYREEVPLHARWGVWIKPANDKEFGRAIRKDMQVFPELYEGMSLDKAVDLHREHVAMGGVILEWQDAIMPILINTSRFA